MKLICQFEAVDMADEIIAVPVGEKSDELHGVLKLNAAGREILELLKEETTEEAIVEALAAKYENDRKELAGYVHKFAEELAQKGLLV